MIYSLFCDVTQRKLGLNSRCVTPQKSEDLFNMSAEAGRHANDVSLLNIDAV
jgi:hypothetical protein